MISDAAAASLNLVAVTGFAAGAAVFAMLWVQQCRAAPEHRSLPTQYYTGLICTGMVLAVIWRGYWQPYYYAVAVGDAGLEQWLLDHQAISTLAGAASGVIAAMHTRYWLERHVGRWWLPLIAATLSTVALANYAWLSMLG